MSRRKQQAIEAARQEAVRKSFEKTDGSRFQRFKNRTALAAGIGLLLALGVIGATVGNLKNLSATSFPSSTLSPSSSASTSGGTSSAAHPSPSLSPTPRLSKEYLYAGSRMLAVEDAGAPNSTQQPSDLVVWRKSSGAWFIRDSNNGTTSSGVFGQDGDKPAPADFDGDGVYDFCVFRPNSPSPGLGTFYIQPSSGGSFYGVQFGTASDEPVPADYDGDGRADVAVWRNADAKFYIVKSSTSLLEIQAVGQAAGSDKPVPADFDGDGRAEAAVFRPSSTIASWFIRQSTSGQTVQIDWGGWEDRPAAGDYDGDGRFDIAVQRIASDEWVVRNIGNYSLQMEWGDISVPGDYDGDGRTDPAVWRPSNGTWYIRQSSKEGQANQLRVDQWGESTDIPIAAPFIR